MQLWTTIVLALQMLAAIGMIGLVLIQHGKGADMGASFGSGASGSLFGATGSSNALSKATAGLRHGVLRLHAGTGLHEQCRAGWRQRQRPQHPGTCGASRQCVGQRRGGRPGGGFGGRRRGFGGARDSHQVRRANRVAQTRRRYTETRRSGIESH